MPPLLGRVTRADSLHSDLNCGSNTSATRLTGESAADTKGSGSGAARGGAVRGGRAALGCEGERRRETRDDT